MRVLNIFGDIAHHFRQGKGALRGHAQYDYLAQILQLGKTASFAISVSSSTRRSKTRTEKVAESEPAAQKKAPVKRAKDARPSKAVTEGKKADIVAEQDAPVRKSTRFRRSAITAVHSARRSPHFLAKCSV